VPWYQHEEIGYNFRMSNVVAGIGRGQLRHLEEHRLLKKQVYDRYAEGLRGLPLEMNPYLPDTEPNFWLSCILLRRDAGITPMEIMERLKAANIESRPIWKPMHMQPVYAQNGFISTGAGEDIFARGLCLPSDIKMTAEEQEYVIQQIRLCFA
jgi:dTDP-4-amino-4,6-dideoxygalactose transaminase